MVRKAVCVCVPRAGRHQLRQRRDRTVGRRDTARYRPRRLHARIRNARWARSLGRRRAGILDPGGALGRCLVDSAGVTGASACERRRYQAPRRCSERVRRSLGRRWVVETHLIAGPAARALPAGHMAPCATAAPARKGCRDAGPSPPAARAMRGSSAWRRRTASPTTGTAAHGRRLRRSCRATGSHGSSTRMPLTRSGCVRRCLGRRLLPDLPRRAVSRRANVLPDRLLWRDRSRHRFTERPVGLRGSECGAVIHLPLGRHQLDPPHPVAWHHPSCGIRLSGGAPRRPGDGVRKDVSGQTRDFASD